MARRKDLPTRHEVMERVDRNKDDMEEKEGDLDKIATDIEIIRQNIESLDFRGTSDGYDHIEESIEGAKDVTVEVFTRENEELDRLQTDGQEFEGDLEDRRNSSESDLGKVSDFSAQIETEETINELLKAKEAVIRDIDFLAEQVNRASDAREKSKTIQERLQVQANMGKRRK